MVVMSIRAINWAWEVEGLKPVERLLLVALADYADESDSCFPGQELLSRRGCCSVRTVQRVVPRLEEMGVLKRERRYFAGGRTSDRYVLNLAYATDCRVGGYPPSEATLPANQGALTRQLCQGNHHNHQENHQFPSIVSPASAGGEVVSPGRVVASKAADEVAASFDEFWAVFPSGRKKAKDAARKAFAKAAGRVPVGVILEGVRRYAADPNLPEPEFRPMPSTWLNQGRWDDEPEPVRSGVRGALAVGAAADAMFAEAEASALLALEEGSL